MYFFWSEGCSFRGFSCEWLALVKREVELHLNLKFKQCPEKLIAGSLKPFALERTGQIIMDPFSPGFCCPTCFISTKAAVQSMIPPKGLQHHDSNRKSLTHCCLNPLNWNLNFPHNHKATYFPSVCALVSWEISLFKKNIPKNLAYQMYRQGGSTTRCGHGRDVRGILRCYWWPLR